MTKSAGMKETQPENGSMENPHTGEGANSTKSGAGSMMPSLKIAGRLNAGFGAVCLVLATLVGITLWQVSGVATINQRIVELRTPTSTASLGMVNAINASLANLRGWMITGNTNFKQGRARVWA